MRSLSLVLIAACGGPPDVTPDAFEEPGPTPADDIAFVAGPPLAAGSWLLVNDWAAEPNHVFALSPDDLAGPKQVVFSAHRVWSMGAADDGSAILFSSWDALQEEHFGLTIGDSIQNSFVYDTRARRVRYLGPIGSSWQNVNDECHELSPDGAYVYVCRRYDFTPEGGFSGWRLGRIHTVDRTFEFLRVDAPGGPFELGPQVIPGTSQVVFALRARPPATGSTLHSLDVATGVETTVRPNAARPVLAPDGQRLVFSDTTAQFRLAMIDLARPGDAAVAVSPTLGTGAVAWAPDGQSIVYAVYDQPRNCDHLERVIWTGAAWSAPERVRDCALTGEFITDLAWVDATIGEPVQGG
jgi:hypothetical protein